MTGHDFMPQDNKNLVQIGAYLIVLISFLLLTTAICLMTPKIQSTLWFVLWVIFISFVSLIVFH